MSKTSLKALTTQNNYSLPKHSDFNTSNLKYTFKLFYLNYIYNLNKFCNIFLFSIFVKQEGKYSINNKFRLVHSVNINKNYLNLKNIYTSLEKITRNKFCFVSNLLNNYSFVFIRYLRERNSIRSTHIHIKNKRKLLKNEKLKLSSIGVNSVKKKILRKKTENNNQKNIKRVGFKKFNRKDKWLKLKKYKLFKKKKVMRKYRFVFKKKIVKQKKFNFLN